MPTDDIMWKQEVLLLPFHIIRLKLADLVPSEIENKAPLFAKLEERRLRLGQSNFAASSPPTRHWNTSRAEIWVEAIQPFCEAPGMRKHYLEVGIREFAMNAFGRDLEDEEYSLISGKDFTFSCVFLLTSLEFLGH